MGSESLRDFFFLSISKVDFRNVSRGDAYRTSPSSCVFVARSRGEAGNSSRRSLGIAIVDTWREERIVPFSGRNESIASSSVSIGSVVSTESCVRSPGDRKRQTDRALPRLRKYRTVEVEVESRCARERRRRKKEYASARARRERNRGSGNSYGKGLRFTRVLCVINHRCTSCLVSSS